MHIIKYRESTEKVELAIMNENAIGNTESEYRMRTQFDLIEKLSEVDMNLVKRVLNHLNDDDLEKRVSSSRYVIFIDY